MTFQPLPYTLQRAGSHMEAGHYDDAEAVLKGYLAAQDASQRHIAYFLLAQVYVSVGQRDKAIEALRGAAESGWASVAGMNYDLGALSGHPAWSELVAAVERNAEKSHAEG